MSQNDYVLNWLEGGSTITPLEAYNKWGVMRLGARVYELKRQGHQITAETVQVVNRYGDKINVAEYKLIK